MKSQRVCYILRFAGEFMDVELGGPVSLHFPVGNVRRDHSVRFQQPNYYLVTEYFEQEILHCV